jgi:hypothetical protein
LSPDRYDAGGINYEAFRFAEQEILFKFRHSFSFFNHLFSPDSCVFPEGEGDGEGAAAIAAAAY